MSKLMALNNIKTYVSEYIYCLCENKDKLDCEDIYNYKHAKEFYEWANKTAKKEMAKY